MAELTLDRVTKRFGDGDIVAVEEASLDVADGEFLVLVGPSGCGKSTTLRMVAGLETVTEGDIALGDRIINDEQPKERDIAMVFQSYALYPHMTARENMSFGLEESTGLSDDDIAERVEDAAATMGISDLLDRKPGELSGGQQQRVALGRAIVRDPEVFLLDEPLSNLDAKLRSSMRTELQRLQEELDVTTVYVTHDQTEAMTMGDRIAILDDGRLQQVGTPLECYHAPANRFVAGFIGEPSMNFFETDVEDGRLVGDEMVYPLTEETREAIGDASRVTLGVRPEDIELVEERETDHDFQTVVDVVEPVGSGNNVYLAFEESEDEPAELDVEESRTFVATIGGLRRVEAGQPAVARIPEDAVHLFDTETGEALHNRKLDDTEAVEPQL
ncbi:ABC transporter ATP-binding protein [Halococcus sp. AFM35]|uniref:ABC transporter ATP-binding protein n=1 Tax=Halococcus sp. AFM35 TaxID=3421653 RepID=UPI003EB99E74